MVGLLELAALDGVEAVLAQRLEALLNAGELPDLKRLREEFAPRVSAPPAVCVEMPTGTQLRRLARCRGVSMNALAHEPARMALMLNELRLPTIGRLWPEFAQRSDKESWQATRFLATLLEHEVAERAKRRIERHRAEVASGSDQDAGHVRLHRRADALQGACHGAGQWRFLARARRHDSDLRAAGGRQEPLGSGIGHA